MHLLCPSQYPPFLHVNACEHIFSSHLGPKQVPSHSALIVVIILPLLVIKIKKLFSIVDVIDDDDDDDRLRRRCVKFTIL